MSQNFKQRLIVGSSTFLLILLVVYLSYHPYLGSLFVVFFTGTICGALWEFYQLCQNKGKPLTNLGIVGSFAYIMSVVLASNFAQFAHLPELIVLIFLATAFAFYFSQGQAPLTNLALTFFGFIYLVYPLTYLVSINYLFDEGRVWILYLLLTTKMTDVGAYISGKKLGQKKLAPYISPNKTWEGALGGFLTALTTSFVFYLLSHFFDKPLISLTFWQSVWVGGLIGIIAQFGDLAESLLKRDSGVKDSNKLPGLGGLLDMVDSLVFTTPLIYILLITKVL